MRPALDVSSEPKLTDLSEFFERVYVLFEMAIRQVQDEEKFTLGEDFSRVNAQMFFFAPEEIRAQYRVAGDMLQKWSALYARGLPERRKEGDKVYTMIQLPDPRVKYRKLAEEAFDELQREMHALFKLMRDQVR